MTLSLCRICLLDGNNIHSLENPKLQEIYEKLSSSKLNIGDGKPEAVCYICHSQLLRCWWFLQLLCRSGELLNNLISNKIKITKKNVSKRHHGLRFNLAVNNTLFVTSHGNSVKKEQEIKEEIICEPIEGHNVSLKEENTDNGFENVNFDESNIFHEENRDTEEEKFTPESIDLECSFTADFRDPDLNLHNQGSNGCKDDSDNIKTESDMTTLLNGDQKTFDCQKCDKKYKKKETLKYHMKKQHLDETDIVRKKDNSYPCTVCSYVLTSQYYLERHMCTHGKEYYFVCQTCNKEFKAKCHLTKHMSTHIEVKPYSFNECGKSYREKSSLNKHMKFHSRERVFSCDHCDKQFYSKRNIRYHMATHDKNVRPFVCEICEKAFQRNTSYKLHIKIHKNEKLHTCHDCGKSFVQRGNMISHMRIHTEEKPFACSLCSKAFRRQYHLIRHMVMHSIDEKPFNCSICNKKFSRKENMTKHKRTHKEKPNDFPCLICKKSFTNKSNMKVHVKLHTGEKNFECLDCHKFFTTQAHLRRHKKLICIYRKNVCNVVKCLPEG